MEKKENLELKNVSMQFKGVKAVEDFSASFEQGRIYGLIGTNGAGKSTIINIISGSYRPTSGEVLFCGTHIETMPPYRIAETGIARTFQNLRLFNKLSVLENVIVAEQLHQKYNFAQMLFYSKKYRKTEEAMREDAYRALTMMGIEVYANVPSGSLAYGHQRRLEIARCLATHPKFLLLDEPAAGMNPKESQQLVEDIRKIHQETDVTILLVEHDMKVVMGLCEYIYVMAFGKIISKGTAEQVRNDPAVIEAYLGEANKGA